MNTDFCFVILYLLMLGRSACFNVEECGQQFRTSPIGYIHSPNYPEKYPNDARCSYVIQGNETDVIEILITSLRTERPCKGERVDYLSITDGENEETVQVLYLTGQPQTPYRFVSQTPHVTMTFVSDSSVAYCGFKAGYTVLPTIETCQKTVLTTFKGTVRSPGYPYSSYPNDITCDYVIKAKKGHRIEITFHEFRLEGRYGDKRTDYLQISDGSHENRRKDIYYDGVLVTPFQFLSKTNRVLMRFVSNKQFQYKGFLASYKVFRAARCNLTVANGQANCIHTSDGRERCHITCNNKYLLRGNRTVFCRVEELTTPLQCIADPALIDVCERNITDPLCPYTVEEIFDFYETYDEEHKTMGKEDEAEALLEDVIQNFIPLPDSPLVRGQKQACDKRLCSLRVTRAGKKVKFNCIRAARQLAGLWGADQALKWMAHCQYCQKINCGTSTKVFA